MAKKKKKIAILILSMIALIIVGGFSVNWYLTFRLEDYLRDKLGEKISETTDGFYKFTFDSLSVSLFTGELKIKGIKLEPDSIVFKQWASIDSLPQTYIKAEVAEIDLLGIDLRWKSNFKKLEFDLFKLQSPNIAIFESYNSTRHKHKDKNTNPKTLYELLSPFIDVLSVKKINFENASVVYTVEDPNFASVYSLKHTTFNAYNFLVDSASSKEGKLLYCDNFDFSTNSPQTLHTNEDFSLHTNTINLNTKDSIIHISGIQLQSHQLDSISMKSNPKTDINCNLESVNLDGVYFSRNNYKTFVVVRLFDINSLDLDILSRRNPTQKKKKATTMISLSDIVSPILDKVAIEKFVVEKAKMKYSLLMGTDTTIYKLESFDFKGFDLVVDSVPKQGGSLKYFDSFILDASEIEGFMKSLNHHWSANKVIFNTQQRHFQIDKFSIEPLSTKSKKNYINASTEKVEITGIDYANGLSADLLEITSPKVKYVLKEPNPDTNHLKEDTEENTKRIIAPFLDYIKIQDIKIRNATAVLNDNRKRTSASYELKNLDVYAHNFFIEDNRISNLIPFTSCESFGFQFRNFENNLPSKDYKLQIKNAAFNSKDRVLKFENVRISPQINTKRQQSDQYVLADIAYIQTQGVNFHHNKLVVPLIQISKPHLEIYKVSDTEKKASENNKKFTIDLPKIFESIEIKALNISDSKVLYQDKTKHESTSINCHNLALNNLELDSENILLNYLQIKAFQFSNNQTETGMKLNLDNFSINNLIVDNSKITSSLQLGSINIAHPQVIIKEKSVKHRITDIEERPDAKFDLYQSLGAIFNNVKTSSTNIKGAYFDYSPIDTAISHYKIDNSNIQLLNAEINSRSRKSKLGSLKIDVDLIRIPIANGFYNIQTKQFRFDYNKRSLSSKDLALIPKYPKYKFAYLHPKNKDWFEASIKDLSLANIDFDAYFKDRVLKIGKVEVNDAVLNNFKNQKIEIEHNIMPMIYEGLQKAPIKIDIKDIYANRMNVCYEELAKNASEPGKIIFTDMNGHFTGFTNVVTQPNQYINLDANGKLMGQGNFTATWKLPVDFNNDHFLLNAHLQDFDLKELNQLISPMAPAKVENGWVKDLKFDISATSQGATINMLLLYNNLRISAWKEKNDKIKHYNLYTNIINSVLKSNNPNKEHGKPRKVHVEMTRDPYHSTFNYLWQILQPAVVESVGVSKKKQNFAKGVSNFMGRVKHIFKKKK